jgi:hypothetical protein
MDCSTPKILTPTTEKSGYRSRFAVQEFYEEIDTEVVQRNYNFSVPATTLENPRKDFGWFLGVGTLIVTLPKEKFFHGFCDSGERFRIFCFGQYEVFIKPGLFVRSPLELVFEPFQYFIFLSIFPDELSTGTVILWLDITENIIGSTFDDFVYLEFSNLLLNNSGIENVVYFEIGSFTHGNDDFNNQVFNQFDFLVTGNDDFNNQIFVGADPIFL